MIGTKLAHFTITAHLGSGGMGEVYQATDSKLGRSVAIKLLPEAFTHDTERAARFDREARVLASLNHPHIAAIYGIEEQNGQKFLVMELAGGETLAERIRRGPIPVDEALAIAMQIAEGLESAHEKGITHRDLKPANIKITPDGNVKVLDFGLAKAFEGEAADGNLSNSPTMMSIAGTNAGMILGTAAYMSPEQAKGQNVDRRTDIFAFGAVLYEMLTGKQAFAGETVSDILSRVILAEPDWSRLPNGVSTTVHHLLRRCLQKDRNLRLRDAGDARLEILEPRIEIGPAAPLAKGRERRAWTLAAVALVAATVLAVAYWRPVPRTAPEPAKISFEIPTPSAGSPLHPAISPDGAQMVAIVSSDRGNVLWVRALENLNANIVPGSEGAAFPFWSPDGRFIAFFADGKLKKVDLRGAPPQTLCDAASGYGGTWNRDDVIAFAPTIGPLFRVSAAGGVAAPLTELDQPRQETSHRQPFFLPDGKHFLYVAVSGKAENSGVYVGSLDSKERKFLLSTDIKAQFVPDNLLFMRENTLMAQRFDPDRLELQGDPFRIAEHVGFNPTNSAAGFTVSSNALVLRLNDQGGTGAPGDLLWFDRTGKNIETVGATAAYRNPVISPDLQHIAVAKQEGSAGDIWILDLMRGTTTRFTFDPGNDTAPLWSPDGSRIVFQSNRSGTFDLYQKNSSGIGQEELLLKSDHAKTPVDWSADGRFLLYRDDDPKTGADLWVLSMTGEKTDEKKPVPAVQSPFSDYQGRFSPDGRFLAYVSNESGQDQVYVQGFPNAVSRWQISTNTGHHPRWRRDGKELFFMGGSGGTDVMAVDVTVSGDGALKAGVPHKLFQISPTGTTTDRNTWDITPDGQRFLVNSSPTGAIPLTVIVNWLSKAKAN